ncbi:oxidoreductase [Exophiala viscosa]|uniref:Oxidoreductase n=1 Tax=Exophiala viscosa TaxID=2486360 RepID=A0AAN6E0J1_9EURO|nr:oxidoreductase [Exophiala viscosa]
MMMLPRLQVLCRSVRAQSTIGSLSAVPVVFRPHLGRASLTRPLTNRSTTRNFTTSRTTMSIDVEHYIRTNGKNDPVWIHKDPYHNRPEFPQLNKDLETDVCIIGAGISGISLAEQLVRRGVQVVMIEARDVLSGETGRTSGHLASDLDDGYTEIAKKFGKDGAKIAAESHDWALQYVGQLSKELGIECEYRILKGYNVSQYVKGTKEHDEECQELKEECEMASQLGLDAKFVEGFKVPGWDGKPDQRDAAVFGRQATFHPTKYLNGVLNWLKRQSNFQCYTRTRMRGNTEKGVTVPVVDVHLGSRGVKVETENGHTITCNHSVETTCVPLQKLSLIAEMEYDRTYCIAIRVPKGSVEDCLLYDNAEAYKYVRMTECDNEWDYMVVGGCDHKVGKENEQDERYQELETWVRERFTKAGSVDYKWSGQIFEPEDYMAFIGRKSGCQNVDVVTGDSGNGLTHGVIAGRLLADEITGVDNPWEKVYDPKNRNLTLLSKAPGILQHDLDINKEYKRFLKSDIQDVEDLGLDQGGVLNPTTKLPQAVYKDKNGKIHRMSALCPHLGGVVCWNHDEKSWDCPVHGSRFAADGAQLCGPSNRGLKPIEIGHERG